MIGLKFIKKRKFARMHVSLHETNYFISFCLFTTINIQN